MLTLRPASAADADAIDALARAAYFEYQSTDAPSSVFDERAEDLRAALAAGSTCALLAESDGALVGAVRFRIGGGALYFFRLAVHPEARRIGIAATLLDRLEVLARQERCERLWCQVRANEARNFELYARRGFVEYARVFNRRGAIDVPTASVQKFLAAVNAAGV